jgi:hypothetical protein
MKFDFAFNPTTIILGLVALGLIYYIFTLFTNKKNNTILQVPLESPPTAKSVHPDPDTSDKVFLNDDGLADNNNSDFLTANEISQFPYKELETHAVNEMYTTDAPLFDTQNKQPLVTPNIESPQRRVNFYEM